MTMATCGAVSAATLGLPAQGAVGEAKATIPKGAFVARTPISAKTKQHLVHDVRRVVMMEILRPQTTGLAEGRHVPEVLVMGLELEDGETPVPRDIVELIAGQRKSGIVFVCTRTHPEEGEQAALAVRRAVPVPAGHLPRYQVHVSGWMPADEAMLEVAGDDIDALWESMCAQAILGDMDGTDVDGRIARRERIAELRRQVTRLTAAHQRARTTEARNEAFAKLAHAKQELADLT
ncbi:MAG: DUF4391 domain-containing protein [Bifidobacterium sp.]|nr:DUF4391 domain-containing protein [Bifidobacterium sp.]